jgi:hypothetical protein
VVKRVTKVEVTFLYQWRVGVGLSEEDGRWWWCEFNASILAREGRRWNETLPEDEAESVSSSWLYGKDV